MRHLALSYGVEAIYMPKRLTDRHIISLLCVNCWMMAFSSESDMVAHLSSGKQGTQTSFLEINVVEMC